MKDYEELHRRLYYLESVDEIKTLKAQYFMACDTKDPELMRRCFVEGEVHIDYGPVGQFSHRDDLVQLFTDIACHPHMLEMHHGHNPVIDIVDDCHAKGSWELAYQLINTHEKTQTQLAIIYRDDYIKIDDQWKIISTVTQTVSTMVSDISGEHAKIKYVR